MKKTTIFIHACPKRLWYVNKFLIPSLQDQGLDDIYLVNDKHGVGNLLSFVLSMKEAKTAWHLQDDVVICSDFAERIKKLNSGVVCGYSCTKFEPPSYQPGKGTSKNLGFSFPCIRIPEEVAKHFYKWFYTDKAQEKYKDVINTGKMDDLLFKFFLTEERPDEEVNNLNPSLVDHIDYLLGGSTVNRGREEIHPTTRATNFNNPELVEKLSTAVIPFLQKED